MRLLTILGKNETDARKCVKLKNESEVKVEKRTQIDFLIFDRSPTHRENSQDIASRCPYNFLASIHTVAR